MSSSALFRALGSTQRVFRLRASVVKWVTLLSVLLVSGWGETGASAQQAHFVAQEDVITTNVSNATTSIKAGPDGSIYIADHGAGRFLKETPSNSGGYTETTLPVTPLGQPYDLAIDSANNLFLLWGVSNTGTISEAHANPDGTYTQTQIDSNLPSMAEGIALGPNGTIYVILQGFFAQGATVLEEIPNGSGGYTRQQLFTGIQDNFIALGIAVDGKSNLYFRSTLGILKAIWNGSSYSTPQPIPASENLTYGLYPYVDAAGNIYVANGTDIEKLTIDQAGNYTDTTLFAKDLTDSEAITIDSHGRMFVADINFASPRVFDVNTSGADFGSVSVGATSPAQSLLFAFDQPTTLGSTPYSVVTQGTSNLDFKAASTAPASPCIAGTYQAGTFCYVSVTFTPTFAGERNGAVVLQDADGHPVATAYAHGVGTGPQIAFPPSAGMQISSNTAQAFNGVAVDRLGNLYVTDYNDNQLQKWTLSGGNYTKSIITSNVNIPAKVAVDGAGSVYVVDSVHQRVLKESFSNGAYTESVILSDTASPFGLDVDGTGNLYTSLGNSVVKETLLPDGTYAQSLVAQKLNAPNGVIVDSNGVVYIGEGDSAVRVLKETPAGDGSYVESVIDQGFNAVFSLAVDAAGDVYVSDAGGNAIIREAPNSNGGYDRTTILQLPTGTNPRGIALGSDQKLYFVTLSGFVGALDLAAPPSLTFPDTNVGKTSVAQIVGITNVGNTPLNFPTLGSGDNPLIAGPFLFNTADAGACPVTSSSTPTPGQLVVGSTCNLSISFAPIKAGQANGTLTLTDDLLNAAAPQYTTQTISLSGNGTAVAPVLSSLTPNNGPITGGTSVTITGSGFTGATAVSFGGISASSFTVVSDTQITATTPAHATGSVNVTVTNPASTSNSGQFTYAPSLSVGNVDAIINYDSSNNPITLNITGGTATSVAIVSGAAHGTAVASGTSIIYTPAAGYTGPDSFTYTASDGASTSNPATVSITVSKASLTVTAIAASMPYGGPIPTLTGIISGLRNGDNITATFKTDATTTSPAGGTYNVTAVLNDPNNLLGNYNVTLVPAVFTVTRAPAAVTLSNLNQTYTDSTRTATVTTMPANLTTTITYNGSATTPFNAGSYSIAATITDPNYTGSTTGTLVIAKAPLTAVANPATMPYGGPIPNLSGILTGVQTGDNITALYTTDATVTSPAGGTYHVTPVLNDPNHRLANYNVTLTPATLTVTQPTATVALGNLSQTYTGTSHTVAVTTTPANLSTTFTYNGVATPPVNAGSYTVVATINDPNYSGSTMGTLVIAKAPLSAVANSATMPYGGPIPTFSGTLAGVQSGDNITASYTTDATVTSPVGGAYHITPVLNDPTHRLSNYNVTLTPAALTVTKVSAALALSNLNQTYTGSAHTVAVTTTPANLGTTITYSGAAAAPVNAGSYAVAAMVNDPNYSGSAAGTLVVAKAATTTAVSANNATLTAKVTSAAGIPTGSVQLFDGATLLTTAALNNGVATYATSFTGSTSHSVSAIYVGDTNFATSTSSTVSIAPVTPLDFTLFDSSTSYQTVIPGAATSFTYNLSPTQGAYPGTVSFGVTGLPSGATFTVSPSTVAPNAGAQTVTLSITTASATTQSRIDTNQTSRLAWALLLLPLAGARRLRCSGRRIGRLMAIALFLFVGGAGLMAMTGCGTSNGFFGQSPHNYTVTMTATSGNVQHASTVTLNVQ